VAGCCECGDEPSGSCATELVNIKHILIYVHYIGVRPTWYIFDPHPIEDHADCLGCAHHTL
jgi:hypothetical protein